jgi:type IV pilus assembly protein PilE
MTRQKATRPPCNRRQRVHGFTLIELMVVVAILAILVGIAYPSYRQNVIKTRRATATGCLLEQSQFMERYYTTNLVYTGAPAPAGECVTDLNNSNAYAVSFSGTPDATTYTLQAVPTSAQNDPKCGTLNITQSGAKGRTGTAPTVTECW